MLRRLTLSFLAGCVLLGIMGPVLAQVIPGSPFGGTAGGGAATANPALNTAQTPDNYYFSTNTLGNALVFGEAADSTFDFAHAQATDPTLFVQSHNQNTAQWIGLAHNATDGILSSGTGAIQFNPQGATGKVAIYTVGVNLFNGSFLSFGTNSGDTDLIVSREGAAIAQLGADVNGAAVAQTLKAHDGVTGSNIIGANLTLSSGIGTGNAAGAQTSLGRALMGATGTTPQTRAEAVTACESKTLSNTSATATTLVNIASASNSGGCAEWTASVIADDGTNFDAESQTCNVCWVNKAGTFTVATPVCTATVAASNSGSTTVGTTVTAATSVVSIKVTPVFTTIVPTTVRSYTTIRNNSPGAVTCQ